MHLLPIAILAGMAVSATIKRPPSTHRPLDILSTMPFAGDGDKFGLVALRSGTPVQDSSVIAAQGQLRLHSTQFARCEMDTTFATFCLEDHQLFLYGGENSTTPQQLWVDHSWMGRGALGYTTGAQPKPEFAVRKGFRLQEGGFLTFNDSAPLACPWGTWDGAWSLWFAEEMLHPDCTWVLMKAIKLEEPLNSCLYSSS